MLVLWGGLFLVLGPLRSPGDGDLYWQRWLGELFLQSHRLPAALGSETFTAAGAPWVPQEWLFSIAVAFAGSHGLSLPLHIAMSLIPLAILTTIYLRARGAAAPEAIGVVLLFTGAAMLESFGVRAQVLGWGALALFLLFLERKDSWQYASIGAAILWANVHASVAIAPVLVLARIVAIAAGGDWKALRTAREVPLFFGTLLALLCTPLGWRLPQLAIALSGSPIRHYIQEWQRPGFGDLSFVWGALPLALAIVLGGKATLWERRRSAFPAIVTFCAMLFASRNIPLFAIAAAPLAATGLSVRIPRLREIGPRVRELEPVALIAICAAMILSGLGMVALQRKAPQALPIAAIASLQDGASHRLLCENFTWCSVALGNSNVQVFIDGRCDAYPLSVWRDYSAAIHPDGNWKDHLRANSVDTVVAGRGSRFATALLATPGWKSEFEDRSYVVLRRV